MDFDINHLRAFMVVARKGNISEAARELGATQPNLGRQMAALSRQVGMELFIRHSRGVDLTRQGKEFFDVCQDIVGRLAQGIDIIREKDIEPQGTFNFITGLGLVELILENIGSFSEKFPRLSFKCMSNVNIYKLIVSSYQLQTGEADAAVIPEVISDPDFIQRPLYDTAMRIYASPHYLQVHSTPKTLEDLQFHKVIIYRGEKQEILNQQIMNEDTRNLLRPIIGILPGPAMRIALINGAGIGCYVYDKKIMEKGLLVDVFPDMPNHIVPYYYTYHKRLEGSPKIEAFYEFLKEVTKVWEWREKEKATS